MTASAMIEALDVHKRFGNVTALNGVSLSVARGQVVCIIGPSGSGKSTLLRCMHFLDEPTQGVIRLDGKRVGYLERDNKSPRRMRGSQLAAIRAQIGMVFQLFYLWPHMTAFENVILGLRDVRGLPRAEALRLGREFMHKVDLDDKLEAYPEHLSGGQRQRVAIARALAMQPKVMLFDEPTSALDPELVGEVLRVIEKIASEGITMVIATHEMSFARNVADVVVFMDQGQIVETGSPVGIFDAPQSERLQRFLDKVSA